MAEFAVGLIFAITKRIAEADKFIRQGKFVGWAPMLFLGSDLKDKTLGIVGLGRIGGEIARRMRGGFNMKVVYYDIKRNEELEKFIKRIMPTWKHCSKFQMSFQFTFPCFPPPVI